MDGLREGPGEEKNRKGDHYIGLYLNDRKHGGGKITFRDNRIMEGVFEGGHLVHGSYTFSNNRKYTGQWEHGRF